MNKEVSNIITRKKLLIASRPILFRDSLILLGLFVIFAVLTEGSLLQISFVVLFGECFGHLKWRGDYCIPYAYKVTDKEVVLQCYLFFFFTQEIVISKDILNIKILESKDSLAVFFSKYDRRPIASVQCSSKKWNPSYWSTEEIEALIAVLEENHCNITRSQDPMCN